MMEIIGWTINESKSLVTLTISVDGNEFKVPLSNEIIEGIFEELPLFDEERAIKETLDELYKVTKDSIFDLKKLNEGITNNAKSQGKARKALNAAKSDIDKSTTKHQLAQAAEKIKCITAIIKSLAAEKVTLDSRRHIIKLMMQRESDLRAQLAKLYIKKGKQ